MPNEEMPFSENENRFLSRFVKPDFKGFVQNFFNDRSNNIKDRRFMNAFDDWFADRFFAREEWIVLKNELEMLQGKSEINDVFVTEERLVQVWRGYDEERVTAVLTAMDGFAERNPHAAVSFMLIPSAQELYIDTLPPNSGAGNQEMFIRHCYNSLEYITGVDVLTPLFENRDSYIFYRTDHHWTSYGAYWGYYAAAARLEFAPLEPGWFNIEHASSNFLGTLYSKTLNRRIAPDIISFYTPSRIQPPELTLTVNTGLEITEHDTLYFREYLDVKDKYAVFLGMNSPIMDIVTDLENNDKSLLIFKDSYAHAMIPFLVNHYKRITVVDMRYINVDVRQFIDIEEYEQILFIYNVVNFSEENDLRKLNLTRG